MDRAVVERMECPLCGAPGTLHHRPFGRRIRSGAATLGIGFRKRYECTVCRAAFTDERLRRERDRLFS